jgi:cubilin
MFSMTLAPRGNGLNLTFSHFELEPHHRRYANCSYDYLAIAEGDRNNISAGVRYCGNNMPTTLSTLVSSLSLQFVSDNSVAHNGFRLEWVVNGCGGQLTKPSATFRKYLVHKSEYC